MPCKLTTATHRELTRIAPNLAAQPEPDSNRNCDTLAWYGGWYSRFLLTTKLWFINFLVASLDAGQGTIRAFAFIR
jgi:hypothetical protein